MGTPTHGFHHPSILVGGLVHFLLGAVWYTTFGDRWLVAIGKTSAEMQANFTPMPFALSILVSIAAGYMLHSLLKTSGNLQATSGMRMGALLALTLAVPYTVQNVAYQQRTWDLLLIDGGYAILGMALMGLVQGAWAGRSKEQPVTPGKASAAAAGKG